MGGEEVGCKFLKDLADAVSEDLHSTTEASQFAGDFDSKRPLDVVTQPSSHSSALESHVKLSQLGTGSRYAPEWMAVASFFDRPLWRRVWIVQEIVRARSAILIFGDLSLNLAIVEQVFGSIEWIERMTAAEAASPSHSCDDDPECALCVSRKLFARLSWTSAKHILYFRSLLRHRNRVALSRILATFVNQVSSVLFDKVYAFLGLAPDDERKAELLRVDYSLEPSELYSRGGAHLIWEPCNLDLLSFAPNWWRKVFYMAEIGEDAYSKDVYSADAYSISAAIVPSWSLSSCDTIARVPLFEGVFGDLSKIRPYSASGNSSSLDLKFSKHHTVLQLKGLIFDKIQILSNAVLVEKYACGCISPSSEVWEGFRPHLYRG